MSYRVTDIEGAIEAADGAAGTIQQLGFVQYGAVEIIGEDDQCEAERHDRQYDPENHAADRFSHAE